MAKIFVQTSILPPRGVVLTLQKSPALGKGAPNASELIALQDKCAYRRVYQNTDGKLFIRYQNAICPAFIC